MTAVTHAPCVLNCSDKKHTVHYKLIEQQLCCWQRERVPATAVGTCIVFVVLAKCFKYCICALEGQDAAITHCTTPVRVYTASPCTDAASGPVAFTRTTYMVPTTKPPLSRAKRCTLHLFWLSIWQSTMEV
jgi:hypothetical protein